MRYHLERAQTKLAGRSLPQLCNLQHAVMCALRMGGAVEVIGQLKDDADDSEFAHVYLASTDFCNTLSALLLLDSGQALHAYIQIRPRVVSIKL
jgi:hypothetical protein